MKTGDQYQLEKAVAVLLIGEPGGGKTSCCMDAFPEPYFLDCDGNLKSAIQRNPGKKFYFDKIESIDGPDGQPQAVPPALRWTRLNKLMEENGPKAEVGSIVVDSMSKVTEYLQDFLLMQNSAEKPLVIGGERVMTQHLWLPYKMLMTRFIIQLRSYGKPVAMTCHVKYDKDEVTGVIMIRPGMSGQLADNIAFLFTDFWMCETGTTSDTRKWPNGVRYFVRTMPQTRIKLKCSVPNMPAEVDAGDVGKYVVPTAKPSVPASIPATPTPTTAVAVVAK